MNANPIEITKDAVGGALRVGRWAAGEAVGTLNRVRGRGATGGRPKELDDVTIARKVETVVFRPAGRDKGKIDVNVVDGVVWLRGEAKTPADVEAIEAAARAVPEVVDVQNLLHLPKTPARRAGSTRTTESKPRAPRRRVNADKTVAAEQAEPLPKDLAAEGQGRPPAPMGAEDATASTTPTPTETPTPPAETPTPPAERSPARESAPSGGEKA